MPGTGIELEPVCRRDTERSESGEPAGEILSAAKDLVSTAKDLREVWCPGPELNRHAPFGARDFKSRASASFATRAGSVSARRKSA